MWHFRIGWAECNGYAVLVFTMLMLGYLAQKNLAGNLAESGKGP